MAQVEVVDTADIKSDEMVLNMGPQHPSTHGVLRLELGTDGEIVRWVRPHIGYLHRCFEKHAESLTYPQVIPFTDRMDYMASMNNNLGYVLEKRMEKGEAELRDRAVEAWKRRLLICRDEGQSLKKSTDHLKKLGVSEETILRWVNHEATPTA